MSIGKFRTFDEFGWASSQSATAQTSAAQAALDSGERLLMPVGETVTINSPLTMNIGTSLSGAGGDIVNTAVARSQFRTSVPNMEMLRVRADNAHIAGINFHADAAGGTGVVMGNGTSWKRGIVLERITTNASLKYGVHAIGAAGFCLDKCWLWGHDAAFRLQSFFSDGGDNKVTDCDFNAASGAGIHWTSGGGLYMKGCKFGSGANHMNVNWDLSGSGGLVAVGNCFETCSGISVDLQGTQSFERMMFVGNSWAVPSVAIAARNWCATNWLKQLKISENTIKVMGAVPAIDVGCVDYADITSNNIDGTGVAQCGIVTRTGPNGLPSSGAIITNKIINCGTPVINSAGWAMTGQL